MTRNAFMLVAFGGLLDIGDDVSWEHTQMKIRRMFPWLMDEGHEVRLLGLGRGWHGLRKRANVTARAVAPATSITRLDAVLTLLLQFFAACMRAARRESAVAIAANPLPGFGVAVAKVLFPRRIPLIVTLQGFPNSTALYVRRSRWQYRVLNQIEGFVLRRGDFVLTGNNATTQLALSHGVDRERILVMPWPVPWAERAEIVDLPERPTVLYAGRLVKEKGIYTLLDAMKLVTEKLPDARLLVAGGGVELDSMKEKIGVLGLENVVSFLGWVQPEELIDVYKESTLLVLPSIYEEAQGMVLVEAGLMGRPVVCTGTGGMCEVVQDGETGLVVDRGDATALGEALLQLLGDRHRATRMGLAGRRAAESFLAGREKTVASVRHAAVSLAQG